MRLDYGYFRSLLFLGVLLYRGRIRACLQIDEHNAIFGFHVGTQLVDQLLALSVRLTLARRRDLTDIGRGWFLAHSLLRLLLPHSLQRLI